MMLKTEFMSKKRESLGIEWQYDLPEVLHILNKNVNTLSEINYNFPEAIKPILRYHYAQNQGCFKKTDKF